MPDSKHHHRAGSLRQSNKRNKRSKASKRSISKNAGGKINKTKAVVASMESQSKADRRNMAQQKRDTKRQELMRKKRIGLGALNHVQSDSPTRLIGIVSLGPSQDIEDRVRDSIIASAETVVKTHESEEGLPTTVTCHFQSFKKDGKLTFLTCRSSFNPRKGKRNDDTKNVHNDEDDDDAAVIAALDMARVVDMILFVIDGDAPRNDNDIQKIQINTNDNDHHSMSTNKSRCTQDWDHLISTRGDRVLTAIKGQGLPTPVTVLAHTVDSNNDIDDDQMTMQSVKSIRRSKIKRHLDIKKYINRFAVMEFGNENDKVLEINLGNSSSNGDDNFDEDDEDMDIEKEEREKRLESSKLVRTLCTMSCSPAKWVHNCPRPYLVADSHKYDSLTNELHLTGYLRGICPFDVNSLLHVPGVGTFACKSLKRALQPLARRPNNGFEEESSTTDLVVADPELRESLNMYATPDALDGEQNLVGFDEEEVAEMKDHYDIDDGKDMNDKIARPAGWSDYQSAWLDAVDGADSVNNDDETEADHGELAAELNRKPSRMNVAPSEAGMTAMDAIDLDDANDVTAAERKQLMEQRKKQQNEELEFPDEVQVNDDENARERFARYRSLKSFRKSHWDPKENLPETYANIYHFASFKQTQRSVIKDSNELIREAQRVNGCFWGKTQTAASYKNKDEMVDDNGEDDDDDDFLEGCVPNGSYVTLTLEGVFEHRMVHKDQIVLTAVSLLQHENKVSVLHMGLCQTNKCDIESTKNCPIKSKDQLLFRCGWRTWSARPIFSQNNLNSDKHKFERFLPTGGAFFAASVFGPVTYTPCPVLVFRESTTLSTNETASSTTDSPPMQTKKNELVAIGSMIGADADRIVIKRIVLTGYPVRVHKRYATVKYMFYNPDDVKWFKPAELRTKHGLQGHIIQSVGEHGTMKCLFNAPIKQHDTVCLTLYKRIYPKYAPPPLSFETTESDHGGTKEEGALVVL